MVYFIAIGVVSIIFGLLFVFAPDKLRVFNDKTSRVVGSFEKNAFTYRMGVGISLIIASLLFFFVAYYLRLKG